MSSTNRWGGLTDFWIGLVPSALWLGLSVSFSWGFPVFAAGALVIAVATGRVSRARRVRSQHQAAAAPPP